MMELTTAPRLDAPGGFYEALTGAPCNLPTAESPALPARLVWGLSGCTTLPKVLRQTLQAAGGGVQ